MAYAAWRKCDLQVHSPRDPNWQGERPLGVDVNNDATGNLATIEEVESSREAWASSFVDKCLEKGLQAVAITDHHELVVVPYVQNEIKTRHESGQDCDIWVFPGMELTAHGGVQALIIFDADLPEEWWKQAQGKLGIVYADLAVNSSKSPRVTQLAYNYADISNELDAIEGLRGKYIVLPNVSQGNKHTVLTDGAHADFLRMPYVGGYLDCGQTIDTLGTRNKKRISGNDRTWSDRKIYPLPTSDARSSTYEHLGSNNTWIKLAEPTAEAIRQAFLAHKSRIAIENPSLPSLWVSHVCVEGSDILEETNISLSPELNSVIGGRGSGKSSFLEYLSFGIGRSSYDVPREHYSGTERLQGLIKDSLVTQGGSVTVNLIQDNAVFQIRRDPSAAHQPQITYPNGDTQPVSLAELRALFPAVVYSQGELAEIGKQTGTKTKLADLLQFVNPDYKREDDALLTEIEFRKEHVRSSLKALCGSWATQAKKHKLVTKRDSLKQRVTAIEKTLPKQSEDDQAVLSGFEKVSEFESKRLQASKHSGQVVSKLTDLKNDFSALRDVSTELEGAAKDFVTSYEATISSFVSGLDALIKEVSSKKSVMDGAEEVWKSEYENSRKARDGVLEKLGEHKTVTTQIIDLKGQIETLANEIGDLDASSVSGADLATAYTDSVSLLKGSVGNRSERTKQWAKEIESLSSSKIKAVVNEDGDITSVYEALDIVSSKTGSQEAKRNREIAEQLRVSSIWDIVNRLRTDCTQIFYWSQLGSSIGEEPPEYSDLMGVVGDTDKIKKSILELMDMQRLSEISTAVPKPEITLSYCDGDREISFEKASEGQRAAALLFMLLEQEGGPLIIDQPEGDLDNKIISDLTDKLHEAKSKRQIIFVSHNANIVVNGASELVAYIGVNEDGVRQFEDVGAIDEPRVCNHITVTMEGGEKAFRDRKDKYGY